MFLRYLPDISLKTKTMKTKHLGAILLFFLLFTRAQALTLSEAEATPSVLSEPEARLLITEVNFKNTQTDWVELYYESPSGRSLNLSGISFADDSKFKTVANFTAQSGQYLLLTFKSTTPDASPYLYTTRTGLTGTTEQFIVYDKNGKVLDAVCWTSSNPTTDEITDMMELFGLSGWHSADTSGCIKSDLVKNNMSISRIGFTDTNTAGDWKITENLTPGATNAGGATDETAIETTTPEVAPAQETNTATENTSSADTDAEDLSTTTDAIIAQPDNATAEGTNASTQTPGPIAQAAALKSAAQNTSNTNTSTKKSSTKTTAAKTTAAKKTATATKPVYKDGDISEEITISEIFPNPKGSDAENEWIEITNTGETDINLGNWSLDKGENSTKPFIISDETTIAAGTSVLFGIKDSKLSLANKGGTVRLLDYEGTLVNEVTYDESPEDQAYGLIAVTLEDGTQSSRWLWSNDKTPAEPNPKYKEMTAIIEQEPQFEEKYYFTVTGGTAKTGDITSTAEDIATDAMTTRSTTQTIYFTEDLIPAPLAKATLLKGTNLKMLLRLSAEGESTLVKYEIITPPPAEQNENLYTTGIAGSLITAAGSAIYFLRKKIPWTLFSRLSLSKQADK